MVAGGFNPRYECNRLLRVAQRRDECNAALPALKGRATLSRRSAAKGLLIFLISIPISVFFSVYFRLTHRYPNMRLVLATHNHTNTSP